MGGSSSSSTTTQAVDTTTQTAEASGTVGDVFQGQNVNYNQEFSPQVAAQFENLVNLSAGAGQALVDSFDKITSNLFGLAGEALDAAKMASDKAVEKVTEHQVNEANPEFAAVQKYIPFAIIAAVGVILISVVKAWRK